MSRHVIVTGGSRGLGAGIVEAFLAQGDTVSTCSRSPTDFTRSCEVTHSDRFFFLSADLDDAAACEQFVRGAVRAYGVPDVLVNNAGVARDALLALTQDADIDRVTDLNLKGTFRVTRHVVRRMLRRHGGRIINISSIVGLSGYRGLSVYAATKAGLDGFTRALARELGGSGITVNSVAPGYLRTEMSHGLNEEQLTQIARRTPLGRLGEPRDVAGAVLFLASPDAAFISGHVLVVDGGVTA